MAGSNDKRIIRVSHPSLSESISFLKENLKPEIRKISMNQIDKKLSQIGQSKKPLEKVSNKSQNILSDSPQKNLFGKNSHKNILEYSFMEEEKKSRLTRSPSVRSFYDKNKANRILVNKKIENLKNSKRIEVMEKMKSPRIDPRSKKMAVDRLPLYLRYQEAVMEKEHHLEALKHDLILQREEETKHSRSKSFNRAEFEDWLDHNNLWKQKKTAKIEYLKKTVKEDEADDLDLIFKPKIDSTSEVLAKMKSSNENIFVKLYNQHTEKQKKLQKLNRTYKPSFTPKINKCPSYVNPNKFYQSKSKILHFEESESPLKIASTQVTSDTKNKITVRSKTPKNTPKEKIQEPQRKMSYVLYSLNLRNFSSWREPLNQIK